MTLSRRCSETRLGSTRDFAHADDLSSAWPMRLNGVWSALSPGHRAGVISGGIGGLAYAHFVSAPLAAPGLGVRGAMSAYRTDFADEAATLSTSVALASHPVVVRWDFKHTHTQGLTNVLIILRVAVQPIAGWANSPREAAEPQESQPAR